MKRPFYYVTGDTHGDFDRIEQFCKSENTSSNDVMIILGDSGINYYGGWRDINAKKRLSKMPVTFFCIHGNHEMRPESLPVYHETTWNGGQVYVEDTYPSLLFAKDGEVYDIGGKKVLVIGGAYSVDKAYRLARGWNWFADEQPSNEIKRRVEDTIDRLGHRIDIVMSHTTPLKYEPIEVFLPFIDQSTVDKSTEEWLGSIEAGLDYDLWLCGHYHVDKTIDKIRLMFNDIYRLEELFHAH